MLARARYHHPKPNVVSSSSVPAFRLALRPRCKRLCPRASDFAKFANQTYLDEAAKRYALGLECGIDEDNLVALELGCARPDLLTPAQLEYKDKLKQKLYKRALELQREEEERKAAQSANFELGKAQYGAGEYSASVKSFEQARADAGGDTLLGGEIQLWLALAYQACGREANCIDLYKELEKSHPTVSIRKQAANLRYILEAPKLKLGEDEVVKIPLLQSADTTWRAKESRRRMQVKKPSGGGGTGNASEKSYWDAANWDMPSVPAFDKWYYQLAFALIVAGLTWYLNWYGKQI